MTRLSHLSTTDLTMLQNRPARCSLVNGDQHVTPLHKSLLEVAGTPAEAPVLAPVVARLEGARIRAATR